MKYGESTFDILYLLFVIISGCTILKRAQDRPEKYMGTREMLAIHYLRNTDISTNDIAFLLGYQEINSFLRAFAIWTGKNISEYKSEIDGT